MANIIWQIALWQATNYIHLSLFFPFWPGCGTLMGSENILGPHLALAYIATTGSATPACVDVTWGSSPWLELPIILKYSEAWGSWGYFWLPERESMNKFPFFLLVDASGLYLVHYLEEGNLTVSFSVSLYLFPVLVLALVFQMNILWSSFFHRLVSGPWDSGREWRLSKCYRGGDTRT